MWNDEDCEGEPVNWFDCHDGPKVWIYAVNDGEYDCEDGEDEGYYKSLGHGMEMFSYSKVKLPMKI